MNGDLVRAINEKCLIEFIYRIGQLRIAEPHDYGVRNGVESLLAFQVGGESRSGTPHGWKRFDLDGIQRLRVLDRHFPGTRADATQHHRAWDTLFARVT